MEEIEYSCEKCSSKAATVTHKFSRLPRFVITYFYVIIVYCNTAKRPHYNLPSSWSCFLFADRFLHLFIYLFIFIIVVIPLVGCWFFISSGTATTPSYLSTASWANRLWSPNTSRCSPTAQTPRGTRSAWAGVLKQPCKQPVLLQCSNLSSKTII